LSTHTKILIVLLTLFSIFLCGIVVTYIGTADNYKEKYDGLQASEQSLRKQASSLKKQVNEKDEQSKQLEDTLGAQISSLQAQLGELDVSLKNAEREKATLLQKVNSWASITKDFSVTTDKQGELLKNTLEELNKVQVQQVKEHKELNETTRSLIEKMAIIDTLEAEKRRILEEKIELQNRLDQLLQPVGRVSSVAKPVTTERTTVRAALPVLPADQDMNLRGLVTAVDLKNSMASISIGTADGVKDGMKFHVTRGDEFLCDILIIDVDSEEAVGILELVQQAPRVGDNVSTNL
jgi:hypothetical protein